jgi:arylsulfatase A-like enzyme
LSSGVPGPRKPSLIFILADDLGYADLGCYGQNKIKTPNLDRLAAEGMRFTSFYAGSTVCAPSRCALMTGLHTGHAYIRGNATLALRPEDRTVAEALKQAGYHNGLVGKWGLGNEHTTGAPQNKGFDEFVGYLDQTHAHDYYTDHLWRYDRATGRDQWQTFYENMDGKKGLYIPDLFTTAATNFVRIHRPDAFNRFKPFFLYLACTIPHANNEAGNRTGNGLQVPSDAPYADQPWPQTEKNKAAMITRLDRDVGRLLERLRQLNLEDNTIVFFSSDNGPHKEGGVDPNFFSSAGPLRGLKRDLYEGGIRVPLIVRWPGRINPGQVNDDPWAFWDFLPTAVDIAGAPGTLDGLGMPAPLTNSTAASQAPVPGNLDGRSMLPTLLGQTQTNRHEFLYWEFHERGFQQAVRMGDWKALRLQPGLPLELYNLKTDLGEKHNVAAQNPEVVARIEEYLKTARTDSDLWPVKKPAPGSAPDSKPNSGPR